VVSIPLPVEINDQPELGRLEVKYRNETSLNVCVAFEDWPAPLHGSLNQASDFVFLLGAPPV
jgi:hypothetical protein